MTTLTNHLRAGAFLVSEGNGHISRDQVTIHGGYTGAPSLIKAGTVLGKITSGGKYTPSPNTGSDGSQTAVAVLFDDVDVSATDVLATVISREAEVRASDLLYEGTVDDDTKKGTKATQLAAVGIIVRS